MKLERHQSAASCEMTGMTAKAGINHRSGEMWLARRQAAWRWRLSRQRRKNLRQRCMTHDFKRKRLNRENDETLVRHLRCCSPSNDVAKAACSVARINGRRIDAYLLQHVYLFCKRWRKRQRRNLAARDAISANINGSSEQRNIVATCIIDVNSGIKRSP